MATITVDSMGDTIATDGVTTLREAITNAVNGDTIVFAISGQINLTSALPTITQDITIDGGETITIDGGGTLQIFETMGATVAFDGLPLQNGAAVEGAAIDVVGGSVTVQNCQFLGNLASGGGGALFADNATLDVDASSFSGNQGFLGGGIYSSNTTVTVTDSTIDGNTGTAGAGGVFVAGGSITANNLTLEGNSTPGNGGGLYLEDTSPILAHVTVTGNSAAAGGGIMADGFFDLILAESIVLGNFASGVQSEIELGSTDLKLLGTSVRSGDPADVFAAIVVNTGGGLLADNGGPVETVMLKFDPSNPALDVNLADDGGGSDARGLPVFDIPGIGDDFLSFADAGAFELQCFAEGTRIATPLGSRAIESLSAGDLVRTSDGRDVPVVWLGVQTVNAKRALHPRLRPVSISARAFDDIPTRDLIVTADHGLVLYGFVINASALVGLPGSLGRPPGPAGSTMSKQKRMRCSWPKACPPRALSISRIGTALTTMTAPRPG